MEAKFESIRLITNWLLDHSGDPRAQERIKDMIDEVIGSVQVRAGPPNNWHDNQYLLWIELTGGTPHTFQGRISYEPCNECGEEFRSPLHTLR